MHHENESGVTALRAAMDEGHREVMEVLVSNRADGGDFLICAVQQGNLSRIKELLSVGVTANCENEYSITPLMAAKEYGKSPILTKIVKVLLDDNHTDVNYANYSGTTALIYAVWPNHIELVKLLLGKKGVDVNHEDQEGMTALIYAAWFKHIELVKLLLNNEADGGEALMWAAENNDYRKIAKVLLDNGVDADYIQNGNTVLIVAAKNDNSEVAKALLDKGANVNYENKKDGNTALIAATDDNRTKVAIALLKHKKNHADVNYKNKDGNTALMVAVKKGYGEMEEILVKYRAK